jgi:DNA-3-methyladenine glycosylase
LKARERGLGSPPILAGLLAGPVLPAARGLLGLLLVRDDGVTLRSGRIVEVEAYGGPDDGASHARHGRTPRNASMFGPSGHGYVYGVYGMHMCLNVVCGADGVASAVLIRAVEPLTSLDAMREARLVRAIATRRIDRATPARAAARTAELPADRVASGPGNVGAAFSVQRSDDGSDLLDPAGALRLEMPPRVGPAPAVAAGPRIGVGFSGAESAARPWRFWITGSAARSGSR